MYDRVNKYTAKYLLTMDGQIKPKRLCRSTFCERDMLSNFVKHKADAWEPPTQTFLGLSRVPDHERSWGGTRDEPKNVCVGGSTHGG